MMRLMALPALLTILIASSNAFSQDDLAKKLIERLEKDNAKLVQENDALKTKVSELEMMIEELKRNDQNADDDDDKKRNGKKKPEVEKADPFELGTTWTGSLDGRNPTEEFHNAITAKVTAREKDGFQIRTVSGEIEWLYNIKTDGKKLSLIRAELLKAPPNFSMAVGLAKINSSTIASGFQNGKTWLKIHTIRPVKNSGVDATISLIRDK